MIIRSMRKDDLEAIQGLTNTPLSLLENTLINSRANVLIEEDEIQGFVMIREIGGINELSQWQLKPGQSLILKAVMKKLKGPVAAHEPARNKERIKLLESAGFEKINECEGVFHKEKAIIFRRG